jgi:hypothetical protein
VAAVKGSRILTTSLVQKPLNATKDGITERGSLNIDNPAEIWDTCTDNSLKLPFGAKRYPLSLHDGAATCQFVNPRTDQMYAIWWR